MATMAEKELKAILDTATGIDGFVRVANSLANFFDNGEFRNEFTISYSSVRWCMDALSRHPHHISETDNTSHVSELLSEEEYNRLIEPICRLIFAMCKWADEESPYAYDITNGPLERYIGYITQRFGATDDESTEDHCREAFFHKVIVHGSNKIGYEYRGMFFKYLYEHVPDYDELMDPASMTRRSLKMSERAYFNRLTEFREKLHLEGGNPFGWIVSNISSQKSYLDKGFIAPQNVQAECSFLAGVSEAMDFSTFIFYDEYAESEEDERECEYEYSGDGSIPAHNHVVREMPERTLQRVLTEKLKEYIISGASRAKEVGSSTYPVWSQSYLAFINRKYDDCVKLIKSAIPQLHVDLLVSNYQKSGRIMESPDSKLPFDDSEFDTLKEWTSAYVNNTTTILSAITGNAADETNPYSTEKYPDKSKLLLQPEIQCAIGVFQNAYVSELERAGDLVKKCYEPKINLSLVLRSIPNKWMEFFSIIESVAKKNNYSLAPIRAAQSVFMELVAVFTAKLDNPESQTITANDINTKCKEFTNTLPTLSAAIAEIYSDSQVHLHTALSPTELSHAIQDALKQQPVTIGGVDAQGTKDMRKALTKPGRPKKVSHSFTRKQIGLMFGVTEQAVYNWEAGHNTPPKGYSREIRENGDIPSLIKCVDEYNHLRDFKDVLNTKGIVRDGFNEEEIAAINCVIQEWLRAKRRGENVLQTIREA